jgi:hypothetical protein
MSYDEEIFKKWREARIKFIADNPATAQALALKVPSPTGDEHIASEHCWCGPEASYTDPETGATVYVHRRIQ